MGGELLVLDDAAEEGRDVVEGGADDALEEKVRGSPRSL